MSGKDEQQKDAGGWDYIWNPRTNEFLGRTAKSWGPNLARLQVMRLKPPVVRTNQRPTRNHVIHVLRDGQMVQPTTCQSISRTCRAPSKQTQRMPAQMVL
ncbi:unnamed protein product [Boreogadus saida]